MFARRHLASVRRAVPILTFAVLGFGGCAQSPQQIAATSHPKEYFPSSKYGPASQRVIADGQPVPHGGGQYLVGKPYTVAGQTYYPSERKITQIGLASWYGDAFHGRLTANGEIYDRDGFSAAHPTMPLPSYARVTNLRNNYSMIVRVNDRGPYHANRVMDVSRHVAETLDFARGGTAKVKVEYVGRASLAGSDNAKLYATLRTDGPARLNGVETTEVAEAPARAAPAHVASLEPYVPQPAMRPERVSERMRSGEQATEPALAPRPSVRHDASPARARHGARDEVDAAQPATRSSGVSVHSKRQATGLTRVGQAPGRHGDQHETTRPVEHMSTLPSAAGAGRLARNEPMPAPRPGRAAAAAPAKSAARPVHSAKAAPGEQMRPAARPVRVAAQAPAASRRGVPSSRISRSRDD